LIWASSAICDEIRRASPIELRSVIAINLC
jgi:hypothetical protein